MLALPRPSPDAPATSPKQNRCILVVDDNEAIHADFRKILGGDQRDDELDAEEVALFGSGPQASARAGFELSFASQGAAALEMVMAAKKVGRRYAVVFMDVRMPPGWDGLETTQRLWEVDPDLQVVICTAYSDKSWEEMVENVGNPERLLILKKPFDTIEVLQLAHSISEKWTLIQSSRKNLRELERTVSERTRELVAANSRLESEIDQHKASEARVREQAELLDKAQDAIFVSDLEDRVLYCNRGAERLYGWTPEQILHQEIKSCLGTDPQKAAVAWQATLETGEWMGDLVQRRACGGELIVESRWTQVCDDAGRPKSILVINTDVTEKRHLEARFLRAQRLESIGTLAGGIAHDLNNMLQPISLAVDLFRHQLTDPPSRGALELVVGNVQRATALVRQVLSFARGVEGERLAIHPQALVEEVVGIIRETFPKMITLRKHSLEEAWPLLGDSTQLHQVLLNLCLNARDAMPDGGTLTLTVENATLDADAAASLPDATAGRYAVFTVTDTGTGIPPELHERIFDPFFTTKEQGKGTGLGLATTYSIIHSHGGFVTVESEEGRGTTFRVFVPAASEAQQAAAAQAATSFPVVATDLDGHGELILVVDDEPTILSVLCLTLESYGFRTLAAANGAEGIRTFEAHRGEIRAVLSDMVMPVMDGPAMIAALKAMDPAVRIIVSSGMASEESLEAVTQLGVARILPKPCSMKTILQALHEVFG